MKKFIRTVVSVFAVALLLVGNSAFAAFSFNNDSLDCPHMGIANFDTRAGWPDSRGCWTTRNVQGAPGETINVALYYHNTSSSSEPNVKIKMTNPGSGPSTSYSFSGSITSGSGNLSLGSATLSVPSNQTLTYVDTKWYDQAHGFGTGQEISTTTSTDILNSGFDLGTVGTGWPSQGYVVAKFVIGSAVVNPVCAVTINASPTNITSGQTTYLNWTATGTNSVIIDGQTYYGNSGTVIVNPTGSRSYTIIPNCTSGSGTTQSVYVNVINSNNNRPSATTNSPRNITEDSVTLRGAVDGNGSQIDGWFEMPCYSSNRYGYQYNVSSATLSSSVYNLNPDTRYNYCAVARNNNTGVTEYGNIVYFNTLDDNTGNYDDMTLTTNRPTYVTTTSATLNGYIDANGNNATRWFRYGTTSGSMNMTTSIRTHGSGAANVSDSVTNLSPNTTYYYQVVASDTQGTHYNANIQQFNTNASFVNNNGSTSAVTTVATNITRSSAQLNGLLLNTTTLATSTYFEYGTDVTMNSRTASKAMGVGTSLQLSDFITGLAPNTNYYFRANAENTNGRVFGSIQTFRTLGNGVVVPPTVITRVGNESPVMLKIENRYELFNIGDIVDYTVTYKNIGNATLKNPLLQVILPVHVAYTNSSRGTFAAATNTLSVPLEDLAPGAGGVVYLQGRVVSLPDNHSQIVTTALLNYTNSNGAQEDAMAYVLNHDNGSVLGATNLTANALFAGGFWPTTLCGWLLLIIIILLIALFIRWLLARRDERTRVVYKDSSHS